MPSGAPSPSRSPTTRPKRLLIGVWVECARLVPEHDAVGERQAPPEVEVSVRVEVRKFEGEPWLKLPERVPRHACEFADGERPVVGVAGGADQERGHIRIAVGGLLAEDDLVAPVAIGVRHDVAGEGGRAGQFRPWRKEDEPSAPEQHHSLEPTPSRVRHRDEVGPAVPVEVRETARSLGVPEPLDHHRLPLDPDLGAPNVARRRPPVEDGPTVGRGVGVAEAVAVDVADGA